MTDGYGGTDQPARPSEGPPPASGHAGSGRNHDRRWDRRWAGLAVAAALALGLIGGVFVGRGSVDAPPPPTPVAGAPDDVAQPNIPQTAPILPSGSPTPTVTPTAPAPLQEALPAADEDLAAPIGIAIPKLGIDQSLIELGVEPDRTLEVPSNGTDIGWWRGGPAPGEPGGAVIAAHVTYNGGQPAVFIDLQTLATGDEVVIDRADGSVATYQVSRIQVVDQDEFPNEEIYRLEGPPALTLITCGGDFVNGSYSDSVIVYARLVADTRAGSPA